MKFTAICGLTFFVCIVTLDSCVAQQDGLDATFTDQQQFVNGLEGWQFDAAGDELKWKAKCKITNHTAWPRIAKVRMFWSDQGANEVTILLMANEVYRTNVGADRVVPNPRGTHYHFFCDIYEESYANGQHVGSAWCGGTNGVFAIAEPFGGWSTP